MNNYSDNELLIFISDEKLREESFRELYKRHAPTLLSYIKYMTGRRSDSEDIMQDCFIKFLRHIQVSPDVISCKAFLITIARNIIFNLKKKHVETSTLEGVDIGSHDWGYDNEELFRLIEKNLAKLPEEYREIFILKEFHGLSYPEIALICKLSLTNAKSRGLRAKQKLIEILKPYLEEINRI